ncbi:MAG: NAD(+) synthase [Clostridia bacterium]|nr:NAD(+) synthase [Clostridia bacterium]
MEVDSIVVNKNKISLTVNWLREQVEKAGASGLLVGLSGGVDSALCAFLIKEAFPEDSLGVILPCESDPRDKEDALKVINACNLRKMEIDLTDIHRDLFAKIKDEIPPEGVLENNFRSSRANLKARLRMSTLYAIANFLNYLVVGTDNKAEYYTGYFTKYGDGGVDILPLANLTKREVREWAKELGVPQDIISKPPTAGLWPNQTDEGELGITYETIDDFLEGKQIPEKERLIIERLHRVSEHKRQLPLSPPKF